MEDEDVNHISKRRKVYEHRQFKDIFDFLSMRKYPSDVTTKGEKSNFRRSTKNFVLVQKELRFVRRLKDGSINQVNSIYLNTLTYSFIWPFVRHGFQLC